MRKYLIVFFWCLPILGWSTQLLPWYGEAFQMEARTAIAYQTYRDIDSGGRLVRHPSDDYFLHGSLSSFFGYEELWAAEIEAVLADKRHHHFNLDSIRLTGRYLLADDVRGDPLSIVVGVTAVQSLAISVNDISSFHHSKWEGECHLSLGRETASGKGWMSRWWLLTAIGTADVGSPWLRGMATLEWRVSKQTEFSLFAHWLQGFGSHRLNPDDFHGYGNIRHYSLDIGFRYTSEIDSFGSFYIEYINRPYACNCPAYTNIIKLNLFYPFGL
jgi:hypothetical protein